MIRSVCEPVTRNQRPQSRQEAFAEGNASELRQIHRLSKPVSRLTESPPQTISTFVFASVASLWRRDYSSLQGQVRAAKNRYMNLALTRLGASLTICIKQPTQRSKPRNRAGLQTPLFFYRVAKSPLTPQIIKIWQYGSGCEGSKTRLDASK